MIATLWPVTDRGAAGFAERFYRRVAESEPADALAGAQRSMLRDRGFSHPYYWAGYRLTGTGQFRRGAQSVAVVSVKQ